MAIQEALVAQQVEQLDQVATQEMTDAEEADQEGVIMEEEEEEFFADQGPAQMVMILYESSLYHLTEDCMRSVFAYPHT